MHCKLGTRGGSVSCLWICSLQKEPQNPHSGSKLTVPEQPLISRLEKLDLTSPPRKHKQCLQTKLGQRERILVERKGKRFDRVLVLSPAKAT